MARTDTPRTVSSKVKRARLTDNQKLERHAKGVALTNAIVGARKDYTTAMRQIAKDHKRYVLRQLSLSYPVHPFSGWSRTVSWTKGQLFLGGKFSKQRRAPTAWNGMIKEKLREANADLPPGGRWKLRDFTRVHSESLKAMYARLTPTQKDTYIRDLTAARLARVKLTRANPKALRKDADATFADMKNDWTSICSRLQMQGFYMAVKTDSIHYHDPKVFFSQGAVKFFQQVLKIPDPRDLALKFEAWVINKLHEEDIEEPTLKLPAAISHCRKLLQDGLEQIVLANNGGKKTSKQIKMNYDNFERQVVERYGVALQGWPCDKFGNPGSIGRENVYKLLEALEGPESDRKCRWVKLSDAERSARKEDNMRREANGEKVYKARKGRAMQKSKQPKSAATVEDSDSDSEGSDSGDS